MPRVESTNQDGLTRDDSVLLHEYVDGENNISLPTSEFPTCNYDACENASYRRFKEAMYDENNVGNYQKFAWALIFLIGVLTALVAYFINEMVEKLSHWKNHHVIHMLETDTSSAPYVHLLGINVGFVAVAAFCVAVAPVAGGSGIPEIKCYLNGLRLPRILGLKTLIAKASGVLFSVSAGLPCGKEGPMIHSGAIIASGVSQGIFPVKNMWAEKMLHKYFVPFRDDKNKRDFISCGAAAGVSAAFGAPVGGVLFALEEGCSYWDVVLTWKIFFCSIVCAFTMALLTGEANGQHSLNSPGMIDFGDFSEGRVVPFKVVEVPWFILIGVMGGLMGALFNATNMQITKLRKKIYAGGSKALRPGEAPRYSAVQVRGMKFIEAILIGVAVSLVVWVSVGGISPICSYEPTDGSSSTSSSASLDETFVSNPGCVDNEQVTTAFFTAYANYMHNEKRFAETDSGNSTFNTLATLQLNSAAKSLRLLFHFEGHLETSALFIHGLFYLLLMVSTYGVAVPSGLFVPSLVSGAVFGRIAGQLIKEIPYHTFQNLHPGTYALVGAAAFLAGVCRLTFSLAVILIEATRDIAYALPLMLAIMTAKLVGDYFNKGIYDEHIEFRHLAFLEHSIPRKVVRNTCVKDFMTKKKNLTTLSPVEKVSTIVRILSDNSFCGFPVCRHDSQHFGNDHDGLMTRSRLLALLSKRKFMRTRTVLVDKAILSHLKYKQKLSFFPDGEKLLEVMHNEGLDKVHGEVEYSPVNQDTTTITEVRITHTRDMLSLPTMAVHDAASSADVITWDQFNHPYTDYRSLRGQEGLARIISAFEENDTKSFLDLRPYMNPQPFLVPDNFSFERCYKLFRAVGMRHMVVVDSDHQVTGIVTRYDLWNRLHLLEHPPPGYMNERGRLVKVVLQEGEHTVTDVPLQGGADGKSEEDEEDEEEEGNREEEALIVPQTPGAESGSLFTEGTGKPSIHFNPNF